MAFSTTLKHVANRALGAANIRVDSRTAERREAARMRRLLQKGYFERPAFAVPPAMSGFDAEPLREACARYADDIAALMRGGAQPGGYAPDNSFFRSPDAEILYATLRMRAPRRIVEVGSGNSTRIIRQAIADGGFATEHVAIDPAPRADITGLADQVIRTAFEDSGGAETLATLREGDVLFIDSSHEVRVGNDVVKLFCEVLPALAAGVAVHVHDVFLPFDYPEAFWTDGASSTCCRCCWSGRRPRCSGPATTFSSCAPICTPASRSSGRAPRRASGSSSSQPAPATSGARRAMTTKTDSFDLA
ncbi:MAG: class I SAM-dependent methyltransferase [Caulobacteraceae bacterium]|nr:class I SAM-dependent methyltransferase [Caulobacteraceae bacterium]